MKNVIELSKKFKNVTTDAAKRYFGKTKPGKAKIFWLTPEIRDIVKKRNRLKKNVSNKIKEWFDACLKARTAINHAKEETLSVYT